MAHVIVDNDQINQITNHICSWFIFIMAYCKSDKLNNLLNQKYLTTPSTSAFNKNYSTVAYTE